MSTRFRIFVVLLSCLLISCATVDKQRQSYVSADKQKFDAYFLEANRQKALGDYKKALDSYAAALSIDNRQSACYYDIAKITDLVLNDSRTALPYAEKAVSFDRYKNEHYLALLMSLYMQNGDLSLAAQTGERLIDAAPANLQYRLALSDTYFSCGKTNKALATLSSAEQIFGPQQEILIGRILIYQKEGNKEKLLAELRRLCAEYPDDNGYRLMLGENYLLFGMPDEAKAVHDSVARNDNLSGLEYLSLATFYISIGDYNDFFAMFEQCFLSDDIDFSSKLGLMHELQTKYANIPGLTEKMGNLLKILVAKHPNEPAIRAYYSDYLFNVKDYEGAAQQYDSLLQHDKDKYIIWEQALYTDFLTNNMERMYRHAAEAVELFPNILEIYRYYIVSAYALQKFDKVVDGVNYASKLITDMQPLLIDFLSMQGDAYHALNKFHESDSVYEKILFYDAENATTLNNYSYFLSERNEHLDKALTMSTKLIAIDSSESIYLDTHAWALFKNHKNDEALLFINKAIAMNPENPTYYEHKGDILMTIKRKDEAIKCWLKAIEKGGDYELLHDKLKNAGE